MRLGTASAEKEGIDMDIQTTLQNQTKEMVSPSAKARSKAASLYAKALPEAASSYSRTLSESSLSFVHTSPESHIDTYKRALFTQPQTDSAKAAAGHYSSALSQSGVNSLQTSRMQSTAVGGLSFNGEHCRESGLHVFSLCLKLSLDKSINLLLTFFVLQTMRRREEVMGEQL